MDTLSPSPKAVPEPALPVEKPVSDKIAENQARADAQWYDTERDMAVGRAVRAVDELRRTRQEIVAVALLAVVLFVAGLVWTINTVRHDMFVEHERAAAARTPYVPEMVGRQ